MTRFLLMLIRIYQAAISPMFPSPCRFLPSCSEYAREALLEHGTPKGASLALWRILRCHPLCRGGYDPVPKRRLRLHG